MDRTVVPFEPRGRGRRVPGRREADPGHHADLPDGAGEASVSADGPSPSAGGDVFGSLRDEPAGAEPLGDPRLEPEGGDHLADVLASAAGADLFAGLRDEAVGDDVFAGPRDDLSAGLRDAAADDVFASLREEPAPDLADDVLRDAHTPQHERAGAGSADVPPDGSGDGRAQAPAVLRYAVEALVEALVAEARRAGVEDVDARVAQALAWVRRRLEGDYTVDDFGFDRELTAALLPVLRPLYRSWFRVEVRGIENVPSTGGALIVANHSGTIALDALMTQLALHDEHPAHRDLRLLGADLLFSTPVVGEVARKIGATLATTADAERLLSSGKLVGVWPEGFKGVGKPFSERYKLQRFGRGGFVAAALSTGVPIIPCSIVGAEETYPILADLTSLARLLGLPFFPVTPTFPLLGPLGLVPLPSKWLIEFSAPVVPPTDAEAAAADDPMVVFDLTDQVRETIQQTLYTLLLQRRSAFF